MFERGRAAGIQFGLSCEDLVALGLQPPASLLTAVAVADGQCGSGAQCSDAQLADRADAPRIAYSSRARPLHTPLVEETKEDLLLELSRRSRVCWQLGPGCLFGGLEAIRRHFRLGRWRCERLLRKWSLQVIAALVTTCPEQVQIVSSQSCEGLPRAGNRHLIL